MGPDDALSPGTVTLLLTRARGGDRAAYEQLFRRVEPELRQVARNLLERSRQGGGLSGTELVNLACARLLGKAPIDATCRRHFFFVLGRAMHDALVHEARLATAKKRGGGLARVDIVEPAIAPDFGWLDTKDLRAAIAALAELDSDAAHVFELRVLGGLTLEQTAAAVGASLSSVRQNWTYAQAWVAERLGGDAARERPPT